MNFRGPISITLASVRREEITSYISGEGEGEGVEADPSESLDTCTIVIIKQIVAL